MAKTSLSSARRGRAHVSRDYTSKLRTDINKRKAGVRAEMSTMNMIGGYAAGVAQLSSAIGTKLEKWDQLEEGGKLIHKAGLESGDIKAGTDGKLPTFSLAKALGRDEDYQTKHGGDISMWDKLLTQAPVKGKMEIGGEKFYGLQVGRAGMLEDSANLMLGKDSDKNMYQELMIGGGDAKDKTINALDNLETMKQARPELPKGYKEGDISTYPQAKFNPEGEQDETGILHYYDPKTGEAVGAKAELPKKLSRWEKHLKRMGGTSKYYKDEEEFLASLSKKHDHSSETGTARFPTNLNQNIVKPLTSEFTLPTFAKTDFSAYPEVGIDSQSNPYVSRVQGPVTNDRSSKVGWGQFDELMSPLREYQ